MADDQSSTVGKALEINLDPLKYGTIVEIGAGQEVARWFFQAGGAAGTVAKTMSAYDMTFSDEIYGKSVDRRYVSRARLERMLAQEFDLLIQRIGDHRPEGSRFFAFANTVAARSYGKKEECHGWLGIRLQIQPKADPDDIILHVRMLDDTNVEQQEALGIFGVNLIHGAFTHGDDPRRLLRGLMDNLKWGRIEIDLVEFRGPNFGTIDNRLMALELVKESLARAALFDPKGEVVMPADALYKRKVVAMRGVFRPVSAAELAMFERGEKAFLAAHPDDTNRPPVHLAEMTMAELANEGEIDTDDFLTRVEALCGAGFHVLISEFFRYFRVRQFLARYSREPVAVVTDVDGFARIMREDYYDGLGGGMLEGLGQLFAPGTTVYVAPSGGDSAITTLDTMPMADHLRPLVAYLRGMGHLVPLGG